MENISQTIKDAFDAISLILVFAFVLFDIGHPKITKELEKNPPPKDRKEERNFFKRNLWRIFITACLPLVVIYGLIVFLFCPTYIQLINSSYINISNFDFLLTAFFIIYLLILGFLLWALYLAVRVIKKIMKIKN